MTHSRPKQMSQQAVSLSCAENPAECIYDTFHNAKDIVLKPL
jgi:hypothetical protein